MGVQVQILLEVPMLDYALICFVVYTVMGLSWSCFAAAMQYYHIGLDWRLPVVWVVNLVAWPYCVQLAVEDFKPKE